MSRPLPSALATVAAERLAAVQYAFRFSSRQIPGAAWRYTSPTTLLLDGDAYLAARISVEKREGADGKANGDNFTVDAAPLEPFVSLLGGGLPFIWNVEVFECYRDAAGAVHADLICEGALMSVTAQDTGFKLTFNGTRQAADLAVPKQILSTQDTRQPWGPDFGLDADAHSEAGVAVQIAQNLVYCEVASDHPRDYFANSVIIYERTVAGQTVKIPWPVVTNIPSPDPEHPEIGYLVLASPPRLLTVADPNFWIVPGYDGSPTRAKALGNFYSRLVRTIGEITGAATPVAVTLDEWYDVGKGALKWTSQTLGAGVLGTDYAVDAALGKVKFLTTPAAVTTQLDLRWPGRGFQGSPSLPIFSPVFNSQLVGQAPATVGSGPTIDRYENADGYMITAAGIGQQIVIRGANFGKPFATLPLTIGGVAATVISWNDTKITCVVPDNETGIVHLHNEDDFETTGEALTIVAAGVAFIDYVADATGAPTTSAAITQRLTVVGFLFGTGGARSVLIGDLQVTNWLTWKNTAVEFRVPSAAEYPYEGTLVVRNPAGDIAGAEFTITGTVATQLITRVENNQGYAITSATAGARVKLIGAGFGGSRGTGFVKFNGLDAAAYHSWSDNAITVTLPTPLAFPFAGNITLQTAGGLTSTGPAFTIGAAAGSAWVDHYEDGAGNTITTGLIGRVIWIIGENFGGSQGVAGLVTLQEIEMPKQGAGWTNQVIKVAVPSVPELGVGHPISVHTDAGLDATGPNFTVEAQ